MTTKKYKWTQKLEDGSAVLLHPETEASMILGKLTKAQLNDVLTFGSLMSTTKPTYSVFSSQLISAQGNTNSTYLVVGGGNFGGYYNGAWLVECSGRGTTANMRVIELSHNSSGTITFGSYVSDGRAYFGITRSSYGSGISVYNLGGSSGELKAYQNSTTEPSGWKDTTVIQYLTTSAEEQRVLGGVKRFIGGLWAISNDYSYPTEGETWANYKPDGIEISKASGGIKNYTYKFPEASGTLALKEDLKNVDMSKYLALAGGTMTGNLTMPNLSSLKFTASAHNSAPTRVATFGSNDGAHGLSYSTIEEAMPKRLKPDSGNAVSDPNGITSTGFYYITGDTTHRPPFKQVEGNESTDYRIINNMTANSGTWQWQLAMDLRSNDLFARRNQNGTWKEWTAYVKMPQGAKGDALCPPTDTIPVFDNGRNATIKNSGVKITDLAKKAEIPDVSNYLPLAGGKMSGEIAIGQGDGNGIQVGSNGRINATVGGSTTATICGAQEGINALIGHSSLNLLLRGKATYPTYNGNNLATISYVDSKIANIVNSAPETLDTLNELAKALGNDPNFATTISTQLGNKADKTELANYVKKDKDRQYVNGAIGVSWFAATGIDNYEEVDMPEKETSWVQYGSSSIVLIKSDLSYIYSFPESSGTIALAENIPDVSKYLPLAGGTLTGTLNVGSASLQTNGYVTGTWLRTTANTHLASAAKKVAVISDGLIYDRTPEELVSDIGAATTEYVDNSIVSILGDDVKEDLNTISKLSAAIDNDPNFASNIKDQLDAKASTSALNDVMKTADGALQRSGGTMTGRMKFAESACSDADGPSFLLAMTSFSAGGEVKFTHVRNLTSKGNLQWTSATHTNDTGYLFDGNYIPTINTLAYWNGAYQNTSSNLTYCADGEILSKNGGTLTANAQLQRAGKSVTWVNGREGAIIRTTSGGSSTSAQYCPIFSEKSTNGSWEFGAYTGDIAHLIYITDTNYTAGTNERTADYQFEPNKSGVVAVTTDISWTKLSGKPSWIGSSKPSYTWSEIGSKPDWVGDEKPSYAWTEITDKPTWIGDSKPDYAYYEISGLMDKLADKVDITDTINFLRTTGDTMTGRLVINKAGTAQSDSSAGHISLQKSGTEYAHLRLTASNSNLAIESKGGIILYGGTGDSGTSFSGSNYVGIYSGGLRASGTVDLTGFRNLGLSGSISHGSATLTLPSTTGTLALREETVTIDQRGAKNGVASLDSTGKVPTSQLPVSAGGNILDAYPVGTIYISTKDVSPATFIGGTWNRVANGRVLVGAGMSTTTGAYNFEGGKTGGSQYSIVKHSHTVDTIISMFWHGSTWPNALNTNYFKGYKSSSVQTGSPTTAAIGGGKTYNVRTINQHFDTNTTGEGGIGDTPTDSAYPPYLVVYMWERIS